MTGDKYNKIAAAVTGFILVAMVIGRLALHQTPQQTPHEAERGKEELKTLKGSSPQAKVTEVIDGETCVF